MEAQDKPTVLYVDDEEINLMLFSASFNKLFTIITANSGKNALVELDENKNITIVVSDMKMPEMNGIEFIKIAKDKYKHIAFFILTGFDKNKEIAEALKSGLIIKYFSKPFDIKDIGNSIQDALKTDNNTH